MRAIADFGLAYGRYPHRTLTIVDPPEAAVGTGGMEYPTFITAGTVTLFNTWPFDRVYEPEIVVAHEFAHQYFQGMVASNEFEEAWLDEGMTEWATGVAGGRDGRRRSGRSSSWPACASATSTTSASATRAAAALEMIRQPSWSYDTGYGSTATRRPALTLAHAGPACSAGAPWRASCAPTPSAGASGIPRATTSTASPARSPAAT